eukprot:TRINITY_DN77394_c0_g1_i1.p1 TRINITY_DN77394_c0_g1~~TRINITY_DN77394_c0_g1_i1.p1  ORF type:complete len:430 (-),score=78.88 TRINITY_DN77394_c0_g1_i1:25-1263(-)
MGQKWKVVGDGGGKGGIIVREGQDLGSPELPGRLATSSVIEELELAGSRLRFTLLSGSGPSTGWVSLKLKGKDLVVREGAQGPRIQIKEDETKAALRKALAEAETDQVPLGRQLPPLPRTPGCPGASLLTSAQKGLATYKNLSTPRNPKLYAFIFPGAADNVMNRWLSMEVDAPAHVEVATYEWPGHGSREKEDVLLTLEDLGNDAFAAFSGAMHTGHFVVVGHSIGALIMTYVCEKAQNELGLKPQAAFVLDRGAPHIKVFSELGHKMMISDLNRWCQIFHPAIWENRNKPGSNMFSLIKDWRLDNDVRSIGWYRFPCPVHVLAATWESGPPPHKASSEEQEDRFQQWVQDFRTMYRTGRFDPWDPPDHEAWDQWAEHVQVHWLVASHSEIKTCPEFQEVLWGEIEACLKR